MLPLVLIEEQDKRIKDVIPVIEQADGGGGYAVNITGKYTLGQDFTTASQEDLSNGELKFGLPAALIVLLLVFGTVTGAIIPMLMAIMSIVVALGITSAVGQVFQLNLFITNMIVAMGLALGIDYSLFIVSRLREERHRGSDTREAIMTVANTATRAVVFSGTSFVLAMIAMLLVPDTTLRSLGLGAVIVGLVSIVVALTFHPAVLMVLGDRVDSLKVPWLGRRVAASAGEEGPILAARRARGHASSGDQPDRHDSPVAGARLTGPRVAVGRRGHVVAAERHGGQAGAARAGARLPQRRDRAGHHRRRRRSRRPGCAART